MNRWMQDVQYALRQLRKVPGFTITAILTLALGIGANAAIFTLVHAVLLRNLPVIDPKTLVRIGDKDDCCVNGGTPDNDDYSLFSYDLYLHLKDNSSEFEHMAAMQAGGNTVTARRGAAVRSLYAGAIMPQMKGSVTGLETQARKTLASVDPNLTVVNYDTFEGQMSGQFNQERLIAQLALMFGVLALVSVGLYGVTAYTVARWTPEIGIRMALGAGRSSVVGMVLRDAMLQAVIGLAIGIPVAMLCVRFVKAQLYQVGGGDAMVLTSAVLALAISAYFAGLIPARRAASTDPIKALRTE